MKKSHQFKKFHSGIVKKQVVINASQKKVWGKISNIIGLPEWINEIKTATYLSKTKRGVGAVRKLTFNDRNIIEEHIVNWENGRFLSYVATSGLPLRVYHATLLIKPRTKNSVCLVWHNYMSSEKMTKKQYAEFQSYIEKFYQKSLKNLKDIIEK